MSDQEPIKLLCGQCQPRHTRRLSTVEVQFLNSTLEQREISTDVLVTKLPAVHELADQYDAPAWRPRYRHRWRCHPDPKKGHDVVVDQLRLNATIAWARSTGRTEIMLPDDLRD